MKRMISFLTALVISVCVLTVGVNAENYSGNKGWYLDGNTWYYIDEDGVYHTGWLYLNNTYYYLNESGAMQTGWLYLNDTFYYLNEGGAMQTGWLRLGDKWYYLYDSGAMAKGWVFLGQEKYLFDNSGKWIEGAQAFLIDISKWQGSIDWEKLNNSGVDAVILRSSYGGETTENNGDSTDTKFAEYIENLNKYNIPYGTYHFNTAKTVDVAKIQAQNVIGILKENNAKPTYPVFVDIETDGGNCDLVAIAKVYMETFIENGYMPGIYANQNYWYNYLNDPELCVYYRWIANYGKNNGYPSEIFAPKDGIENYMIWQYTDKGRLDGINGNVDLDVLFKWFKKPDGWLEINNKKFYYSDGYMKYGWFYENGGYIYLKPSGELAAGWLNIDNRWYYFNEENIMQTGWLYLNGTYYYLDESGAMQTGWLYRNNTYYYLDEGGAMQTGWLYRNNTYYYLNEGGAMQTGWLYRNNTYYYLNEGGAMQTGWLYRNNTYYYLNEGGAMQTGWLYLNGTNYYFDASGAWIA